VTSPRQAGSGRANAALRKSLSVLGGLVLFWLVASAAIWAFTGPSEELPGVFTTTTSQQPQPGIFANTTSQQQTGTPSTAYPQQLTPDSTTPYSSPTYTIPTPK
jgi:hypothetical protein